MQIDWLGEVLGGEGLIHSLLIVLALAGMLIAIGIWVLEFSGRTITRHGIVKNNVPWDAVSIALIAVSAAIYIAGRPIQFQFIPGIGGFNPTLGLAPIFAVLFGLPGAIGVTFSMPIGDAISGALTLGSVAGFLSHTFVTWLPYKMVKTPNWKMPAAILSYVTWAVIVGPIIHAIVIPGWLDFTSVLPPAVAWGGVTPAILLNHGVMGAIVGLILVPILYPVVKARGLYWKDRYLPDGATRDDEGASFQPEPTAV
jgi:energy-coupling factor transport system substrate-specific component